VEIVIAQGCVTAVTRGPESEKASAARQIASYLPLPSLLDKARVLHDQDGNMTSLQLPTYAGPALVVMPAAEEFEYVIIHEGEAGRRIIGTVRREDRRVRQPLRVIAYRVTEFLRSRALV
jgi:hypothetical protein